MGCSDDEQIGNDRSPALHDACTCRATCRHLINLFPANLPRHSVMNLGIIQMCAVPWISTILKLGSV